MEKSDCGSLLRKDGRAVDPEETGNRPGPGRCLVPLAALERRSTGKGFRSLFIGDCSGLCLRFSCPVAACPPLENRAEDSAGRAQSQPCLVLPIHRAVGHGLAACPAGEDRGAKDVFLRHGRRFCQNEPYAQLRTAGQGGSVRLHMTGLAEIRNDTDGSLSQKSISCWCTHSAHRRLLRFCR